MCCALVYEHGKCSTSSEWLALQGKALIRHGVCGRGHGCTPRTPCATGVVREKVGDIIVLGERGAQAIVDVEMVEHFESALERVSCVHWLLRGMPAC